MVVGGTLIGTPRNQLVCLFERKYHAWIFNLSIKKDEIYFNVYQQFIVGIYL